MSLKLAFQHYDSLDQLYAALDDINRSTAAQFMALSSLCDAQNTEHFTLSKEQFQRLFHLTVLGTIDAVRMLGRIQLAILEDNPDITRKPRAAWEQTAAVVPTANNERSLPANRR